jgi:hypothetical protein
MTFLDIALPLAEKGFRVFPLLPKQKRPYAIVGEYDHFDAASTDEVQLREWDAQVPNANVGLSPDEIFCFLETDDEAALKEACADLTPEVWDTTRVSARPNRCYYIFRQTMRTKRAGNMTAGRDGKENLFEFKQHRMYVTGPGSIHPKTNAAYLVEWKRIPAMPDVLLNRLCELYGAPKASEAHAMSEETKKQTTLLDCFLSRYEVATTGEWFNKGNQWFRPIECPWKDTHENPNEGTSTCVVYTQGGGYGFDCKHRCSSKGWKEFRSELERRFPERTFSFVSNEPNIPVTIGGRVVEAATKPVDWRARYHTFDEMTNAPEPTFIVEGFLQRDVITAIAAPVGQRKTIIAANVVHASITGEPLFEHFKVANRPARVLYLCPEMGLFAFSKRIRDLGLMPYVGKTLFCRTMNSEGRLSLRDLTDDELAGALVVVDTAVRFVEGDENSSQDMKVFAEECFRLMKAGAASVIVLFHSPKGTKEASDLTLENAMRGSGDLGAFVSSCWATRLQDPDAPWESTSYLKNVKQRDFESDPFTVKSDKLGRLHIVDKPGERVVLNTKPVGTRANADGKEEAALQVIRDNPALTQNALVLKLKEAGIKRSKSWVGDKRRELLNVAVKLTTAV